MGKLIDRLFTLLSSLLIFSSTAQGKNSSDINVEGKNIPNVHNINTITNLENIELISKPLPLVLKQSDFVPDDIFAGHSSHASHASHRSHASHYSGSYQTTPEEQTTPLSPATPSDQQKPQKTLPGSTSSPESKKWQAATEWQGNACKLYKRDVIITLKNKNIAEGFVNECKGDAIEITTSSESGTTKRWIELKDIETLLWR